MLVNFELGVTACASCDRLMLRHDKSKLFPMGSRNQSNQMKEKGIVYQSSCTIDDEPICEECAEQGKGSFTCALCHDKKDTSKKEEAFGDPAEYLCSDCYHTVPASVWGSKYRELSQIHRYDFE